MSLFWKKYTIEFKLKTKDNKQFRYVYVDFEQKRNWYWFTKENKALKKCLMTCIQEWFLIWINIEDMFDGKNINRLIDDRQLRLVNSHINTWWNLEYQPDIVFGQIRNIKITHLIK